MQFIFIKNKNCLFLNIFKSDTRCLRTLLRYSVCVWFGYVSTRTQSSPEAVIISLCWVQNPLFVYIEMYVVCCWALNSSTFFSVPRPLSPFPTPATPQFLVTCLPETLEFHLTVSFGEPSLSIDMTKRLLLFFKKHTVNIKIFVLYIEGS